MLGLMQDWPLLCHKILDHAATQHPRRRIASYSTDGVIETNYGEINLRARRVAQRLAMEGVAQGDRVGTVATTNVRHLECWYGALGLGAIYHPINPRLFGEQIAYIVNHAQDRILFIDPQYVPLLEGLAPRLTSVQRYVILTDAAGMPETSLRGAIDYESWLADADGDFAWARFDENTAAGLSYTSGTTGAPKGVLYSHRSIVLLSLTIAARDMYGFSACDTVLAAVPMYHANGWSWPFTAPITGASLVLPGPQLDAASLIKVIANERVTISGGVPTLWQGVLQELEATGATLSHLKKLYIGGAPCPHAMIKRYQETYAVEIIHAWGMTEMGPTGSLCADTPETRDLTGDARIALQQRQGRAPFLVEMKLVDKSGVTLPWDDSQDGNLRVRGPCIIRRYYGTEGEDSLDADGFFDTGDVARIDSNAFMRITDRDKDLIKSGGEWISSVALEDAAMMHPAVLQAAAVGVFHPKWDERPVLTLVLRQGKSITAAEMSAHLKDKIPSWWMPDRFVFDTELPLTATGKVNKVALRERYRNFLAEIPPNG